ncbi:hypothetical protein HDU79_001138, partial [Rhizoclosmatium sp. JEL0117]
MKILAVAGFFASSALVTESAAVVIKRQDLIGNVTSEGQVSARKIEQPPAVIPVTGDCQILHAIWPGFPATGNDCCKAFGISCTDGFITR